MEYNKKNLAAKLNPTGGNNSEYEEETDNEVEDDDDLYMEQNISEVRKTQDKRHVPDNLSINVIGFLLVAATNSSHLCQFLWVLFLSLENWKGWKR